ncbi:MAG: TlpA family protein disulfide reductase [Dyadobacter sp.]|uniref:peroxiredoxin family protein n=1 Tax=Dyadobacter sp. TaxID=1914288 RepID=UPI001B13B5D3|nr:TlpA disulfide reductase family protein [Dyadobacter sp.]MBO9611293.1 TlpA family protein disulfide reductase [Dyadobacter sp.]
MKQYMLLLITILPLLSYSQDATIKTCGSKLYETQRAIYVNDSTRKLGLNHLSGRSNMAMQRASNEWSECVRGKKIPDLEFKTINGKRYRNADLRGKVLVINFWFKGCKPCVAEMPSLNKLVEEFRTKNVNFIGFATDNEQTLKPMYYNTGKFRFDIVANSQHVAEQFVFSGFPTTYIVDQNGIIVKAWTGNMVSMGQPYVIAKPIIDQLLSQRR